MRRKGREGARHMQSDTTISLTCQSVIHIKAKAFDLLHGQASVDKNSKREQENAVIKIQSTDSECGAE